MLGDLRFHRRDLGHLPPPIPVSRAPSSPAPQLRQADGANGRSIVALMEELNADGATIVIITHDHILAARMPRQVEMLDGRIVRETTQGAPS